MACLVALGWLLPASAIAQTIPGWRVGPDIYYYAYREPNFVVQKGPFAGVETAYTWKLAQWFITLEGDADAGYLNYKSNGTGTLDGLWNFKGEARGLIGGDIGYAGSFAISPYVGVGYRILFDAANGRTTSTGAFGYDRLSQYFYIPIGVSLSFVVGDWVLRPNAEYDFFAGGYQVSYLSQVGFSGDVSNRQTSGYGARASFLAEAPAPWGRIAFGPFIRYWNIADSRSTPLLINNVAFVATEPHNNTIEAGLTLRFLF
jgi:hypothetical protein